MIDKICWFIVTTLYRRVRIIHVQGKPYLLRCYLKHGGVFPGIYLHYFYVGDEERHLHNHPWKNSRSFILTCGYAEERLEWHSGEPVVQEYIRKPFTWNKISSRDFHRVKLINGNPWTIFISGKKMQDWGFFDPYTKKFVNHLNHFENTKETGKVTDINGVPATLKD